jgi:hypothetical protein
MTGPPPHGARAAAGRRGELASAHSASSYSACSHRTPPGVFCLIVGIDDAPYLVHPRMRLPCVKVTATDVVDEDKVANERVTENVVRRHFESYSDNLIIEEQRSSDPTLSRLMRAASKHGPGAGVPEFLIRFKDQPA